MSGLSETRRRYKGSNLFLIRFWAEDMSDGTSGIRWRGKVQRVMDGESHDFDDLEVLIDLLLAMLSTNERRQRK